MIDLWQNQCSGRVRLIERFAVTVILAIVAAILAIVAAILAFDLVAFL